MLKIKFYCSYSEKHYFTCSHFFIAESKFVLSAYTFCLQVFSFILSHTAYENVISFIFTSSRPEVFCEKVVGLQLY